MLRRITTPEPEIADPAGYADEDDPDADLDDVTLYDDTDDDADEDEVYRAPTAPARLDAQRPQRARWAT